MGRPKDDRFYSLENVKTGEIVEGSLEEVASVLKCFPYNIQRAASENRKFLRKWEIQRFNQGETFYPSSLLKEWDMVTDKAREYRDSLVKARANRLRTPQQIR